MRIPMYSVMGGAPVGCSPRIKGGVPGRAIVKFLHFCIMAVNADLAERLSFSFPRLYASHIPHKMACMRPFMVRMHMTKKKIRQMPGSFAVGRSSGKAAHGRKSAALESSQSPKLC